MYLERRTHSLTKVSITPFPDVPGLVHAASCVLLICIHVLGNPIAYNDPTGHCAARGTSDEADECWNYLQFEFCHGLDCGGPEGWRDWVLIGDGLWDKNALLRLHIALIDVKTSFQNIGMNYLDFVGNVKFNRVSDLGGANGRFLRSGHPDGSPTTNIIETDIDGSGIFTFLHELGHAVDYSGGIAGEYDLSNTFHDIANSIYWEESDGSMEFYATAEGYYIREYGQTGVRGGGNGPRSPREGYADAFASWAYQGDVRGLGVITVSYSSVNWEGIYSAVEASFGAEQ